MRGKKLIRILCIAAIGLLSNSAALADGLPDLAPIALQVPDSLTAPPNPTVSIVWGVTNQGAGPTSDYKWDSLYLSSQPVIDGSATYLNSYFEYSSLAAGESYWRTNQFQLPLIQSGPYYLIIKTDSSSNVSESDEDNNLLAVPFTFESTPSDLVPVQLLAPADITAPPNPTVTVAWQVANQGIGPALNTWQDVLYVSTNDVMDYTARRLGEWQGTGPIEVGNSYWLTNTLRIPVTESGVYYLIIKTDEGDWLAEFNPYNNELALPISFTIQPPDLAPVALLPPPSITAPPYPSVTLVWCVTNQGIGAAIGLQSWGDQVLFSTDNTPGSAVYLSTWYETGPVPAGGSYWRTNTVRLPVTQSGTGYLILKTDAYDNLVELDNNNNLISVPVAWTITPSDLVPITSQVPGVITGPPNPIVPLVWGVTNCGIGAALGGWADEIYLSTDTVLDWQDSRISYVNYDLPLAPGGSSWQTNTVRFPVVTNGTYYLIFRADDYSNVVESDEVNNIAVVPVTFNILAPDLVPLPPAASLVLTASPRPNLTLTWGVTNQGIGPAIGNWDWVDTVYFSPDPVLDDSDQGIANLSQPGPIPPEGSYWWTNALSLPVVQSGTYYLLFKADAYSWVYESDETNNLVVVPITYEILHPDLAPIAFNTPSTVTSPPNPSISFAFGVTNQGTGVASGIWADQLWLSTNAAPDGTETFLASLGHQDPLGPAQSYWVTNSIRVPVTSSGSYFLIFRTAPFNEAYELNTNNNYLVVPIAFTIQPPDLAPAVLQVPGNITGPPNPSVTFTWAVTNQGIGAAVGYYYWSDSLYISTKAVFDSSALFVTGLSEVGPIAPGTAYWRTNAAHLPVVKSGAYYFFFVTDAGSQLFESDESNNVVVMPVTLNIQPPDLVPSLYAPAVVNGPPNPSVSITWGVTNQGTGIAIPSGYYWYWTDRIYFSRDAVLDYSDTSLASRSGPSLLDAGAGYGGSAQVQVPITQSGTGYLIIQTDADNALFEANENNNLAAVQVTFNIQPADLAPLALSVPSVVTGPPNPKLLFSWGVTNQGVGAAMPEWQDRLYFSTTPTLDSTAIYTSYEWYSVSPGTTYWRTNVARAPVTTSGTYYFIFAADAGNSLCESNFVNNTLAVPVAFHIDPPDLVPVLLSAPGVVTGPPNPTFTFSYAVTNQGEGVAIGSDSWIDQAFISTHPILDGSETPLTFGGYGQSSSETGPVTAHRTYWRTRTVQAPVVTNGNYYLIFEANAGGQLFESNATNNLLVAPIAFNVQSPDLAPITLLAPRFVSGGPSPTVTLVWGVTNQGAGPATLDRYWQDVVYLSTDTHIHAGDPSVATISESGPVAPGSSYWRTNTFSVPVTESGTYYLILKLNEGNALFEADGSNNVAIAPVAFTIGLPDLAPLALRAPTELTGPANPAVTLVWGVTNQGTGPAQPSYGYSGSWLDQIYLSSDPVLDQSDVGCSYEFIPGPLPSGGSYWKTNQVHLPLTQSGDYYLILRTDDYGYLQEANRGNNALAVPLTFHMTPPDLAALALRAPGTVSGPPCPTVALTWGVTNLGIGAAEGRYGWSDTIFLSTNAVRDGTELGVGQWEETNALPAGSSYWRTNLAQLPVTQSGSYYLILETDVWNNLAESNLSNNAVSLPVTVHINLPDLAPVALQAPASLTTAPYPTVKLVWGVTNQGVGATSEPADWYDLVCFSTNDVFPEDPWATLISLSHETNDLPAGDSYWRTNDFEMRITESGTYYLWLAVDVDYRTFDANRTNNSLGIPINLQLAAPDLAPTTLLVPDLVTGPPYPSVSVVIGVTNQGSGPALGSRGWTDDLYLSSTPFFEPRGAVPVALWPHSNNVPPGGSYWITNTIQMPVMDSASYYLLFVTDAGNNLFESNAGNNTVMAPISFELASPSDLTPTDLSVPPVVTGSGDELVTVAWHVANQGLGPAAGSWSDALYLTPTPNQDWTYRSLLTVPATHSLSPGGGYWQTNTISLAGLNNGSYYLILDVNATREWFEADWYDNRLLAPIQVNFSAPATPRITAGQFLADGTFELVVFGQIGTEYVLQASTDLASWVNVTAFTCYALPTYVTDLQAGSFPRRFYRVASIVPIIPPALTISSTATDALMVSWPLTSGDWVLEQSSTLAGSPPPWTQVQPPYQTSSTQAWITVSPASGNSFYRLRGP